MGEGIGDFVTFLLWSSIVLGIGLIGAIGIIIYLLFLKLYLQLIPQQFHHLLQ